MRFRCCLLLAFLLGLSHSLSADVLYSVTDLGTLPGDMFSSSLGINNAGQVVGQSFNNTGPIHAFLYTSDRISSLDNLVDPRLGIALSEPSDINDHGQIVSDHYLISTNGQITSLGFNPKAINNIGQVVGGIDGTGHALLYTNGQVRDLGTFGGLFSLGYDINDAGQVTGYASTLAPGVVHAFLYSNGQMTDLGTLVDSGVSEGFGINNSGQVTGWSSSAVGGSHAFLYSNGQMIDLGALPGDPTSIAVAINDAGQIVGDSFNAATGQRAFLYSNGEMTDLNSLIDPTLGIALSVAGDINHNGQIVANGTGPSGFHAFLLTPTPSPVPEPSTLALLRIAALALPVWARLRST